MEPKKMKILVLGGTGMAGHTISMYLNESGHDVTTFTRKKIYFCNNINGDITDFNLIKKIIVFGEYDAIINAIGILNNQAEDFKTNAILINTYLPHFLSEITGGTSTKIVHISTDCVFSGKKGDYNENDFKDGETFYDRSKALGEIVNNKDLTFRTSIFGPDLKFNGIGLFNWFMKQEFEIKGFNKAIWTGVSTLTLAKGIELSLYQNLSGIYNLVNNQQISKFKLLALFNKYFKDNQIRIIPDDTIAINKSLCNNRIDFLFQVPSYEEMISEMKIWIINHKDLYPHYKR
jgi:dTDP-4-dehydrorhamnose reductase